MTYDYKWYAVKVTSDCEHNIRALIGNHAYFKDALFSCRTKNSDLHKYQPGGDAKQLTLEVYLYMYLCDESKDILNKLPDFCSDNKGVFKVISDSDINLKIEDSAKYKWYALQVPSSSQDKVCRHIMKSAQASYFKNILAPDQEPSSKKTAGPAKKFFSNCVFVYVNLCDEVLNFINSISSLNVYGFLGMGKGGVPAVIPDHEIEKMNESVDNDNISRGRNGKIIHCYEKGEKVRINGGLFETFIGKVDMVHDNGKTVCVEVLICGASSLIEVDMNKLEKIEN